MKEIFGHCYCGMISWHCYHTTKENIFKLKLQAVTIAVTNWRVAYYDVKPMRHQNIKTKHTNGQKK